MGQSFSSSIQEEYADSSSATALHSKNRDETTSAQALLTDENVVIHNDSSKPFKHKNVSDEEHQSSKNTTSNSLDSTASIAPSAPYNNTSSRCSKRSSSLSSHDDVDDQASMPDLSNKIPEVSLEPTDSHNKTFYYSSIVVTSLSDILKLTNSEIKTRLANTQFSVQGIREANNVIAKYNLCSQDDTFSWYQDQKSIHTETTPVVPCQRQSKTGHPELYNDQARQEAQTQAKLLQKRNHMKLALFVLKLSPQLKSVRFKMVPSKISESNFWNAVFYMLLTPNERENVIYGHAEMGNHSDGGDTELKRTLLRKNREIVELQQQVMNLQQMLANLKQQHQQYQQQSLPMTLNNHCGKWIMDKESHEFLALDEEIKSKLRDGKKKRLEDVQEQMKFILDSDNVEDSRGRWDCCGKTSYESRCSCSK